MLQELTTPWSGYVLIIVRRRPDSREPRLRQREGANAPVFSYKVLTARRRDSVPHGQKCLRRLFWSSIAYRYHCGFISQKENGARKLKAAKQRGGGGVTRTGDPEPLQVEASRVKSDLPTLAWVHLPLESPKTPPYTNSKYFSPQNGFPVVKALRNPR